MSAFKTCSAKVVRAQILVICKLPLSLKFLIGILDTAPSIKQHLAPFPCRNSGSPVGTSASLALLYLTFTVSSPGVLNCFARNRIPRKASLPPYSRIVMNPWGVRASLRLRLHTRQRQWLPVEGSSTSEVGRSVSRAPHSTVGFKKVSTFFSFCDP